jgi:mycofactocin precursor
MATMAAATDPQTVPAEPDTEHEPEVSLPDTNLVEEDLLVEEISIDGMCGVY